MTPAASNGPAWQGRAMILTAAVLWNTGGAFTRVLGEPTALGLDEPRLDPLQIAAGRVLFAALVLVPLLRRRDPWFRAATAPTAISPMLNPVWAYLVSPERERPTAYVILGGTCILGALAYCYWPGRPVTPT